MYDACMTTGNLTGKRPTRLQADGAFFVVWRGSSSGQGRGDYTPETPSSILAPRTISSGPASVAAATSPCLQPRDCAPWYPTVSNIVAFGQIFHGALYLNVTDCAREHSLSQQAN